MKRQAFIDWLLQLALAADQFLSVCLFFLPGGCWADETLSARAWRCRDLAPFTYLQPAIDRLFFWQKDEHGLRNHCERSFRSERQRRHLPPELRPRRRRPAA